MKVCCVCQHCYDDSVFACSQIGHPGLREAQDGHPEMIDGYRLESLLGSEASADIFRARQIASDASCLIKILTPSERFLNDARVAARLLHPNIVDIYETGALNNDRAFVVMEDASGRTLREYLRDTGVPDLLTTIELVRQTADALHVLHLAGLTHGAINPDNIILTIGTDGRPMVRLGNVDLGGVVGRSITGNKLLIDSYLARLRYFAPEQFSGDEVGPLSDIYSLGVVFYEMLAGRPPFDAVKAVGLIEKHRNERPPDIRIDNFELRMLVTHSLMESLQKFPGSRQPSANFFARQLRHIEQLAVHSSTPPPAGSVPVTHPQPAPAVVPERPTAYAPAFVPTPVDVPRGAAPIMIADVAPAIEVYSQAAEEAKPGPAPVSKTERQIDAVVVEAPIQPSEEPVLVSEPIVCQETTSDLAHVARRSRLKSLKKKIHSLAARIAVKEIPTESVIASATELPQLETPARAEKQPVKIDWQQPEDDIPSLSDAMAALSKDSIATRDMELPAVALKPEVMKPVTLEPQKTRDVIPTPLVSTPPVKPAAIERSTQDRVAEKPALPIHPPVKRKELVSAVKVSKLGAAEKPSPAIQSAVTPKPPAAPVNVPREPQVAARQSAAAVSASATRVSSVAPKPRVKAAVTTADQEEITVVRARSKPIRIDLEQVQTRRKYPRRDTPLSLLDDIDFFPTILGENERDPAPASDHQDGMFAIYHAPVKGLASVPPRFVAMGVGFLALISLVLFASITRYFPTSGAPDSVTASSSSPPEAPVASAQPIKMSVTAPEKTAPKRTESTGVEDTSKTSRPQMAERESKEKASQKNRELVTRTTATRPAETAKSQPKTKTEKRSTTQPPAKAPKAAGVTRPRIVKAPSQ